MPSATSPTDAPTSPGTARPTDVRLALLRAARTELASVGPGAISLRAIARRAGVSHAAPKHHFGDRAGLLTALAVEGYRTLAQSLTRVQAPDAAVGAEHPPATADTAALSALGRAYVDTALAEPEIFALMFRPDLLHVDDPDLLAAQRAALHPLVQGARDGAGRAGTSDSQDDGGDESGPPAPDLALIAWSFAHGLAVLAGDGALTAAAGLDRAATPALVDRLVDAFSRRVA